MSALQSLWIALAALLFAVMGVCVKYASNHMGLIELVFYRSLIGCVLIAAMARFRIKTLRTGNFSVHLARGIFGFMSLVLFFYAVTRMNLSSALALLQTSPLFLVLLSMVFGRERPAGLMLLALAISFAGMLFVLRPLQSEGQLAGGSAALLAGLTAGCAYYNIRRLGALQEGGIRTVFYFTLISTILALPLLLLDDIMPYSHSKLLWAVAVGLTASFGQLALTRGLHYGKTVLSSSLMYSSILFSGVMDYVFWGSLPDRLAWVGIALIVGSNIAALKLTMRH